MYYMKRNGNSLSASSVVLMTIAISYKLVLVLIGIGMWIFWNIPLKKIFAGILLVIFLGIVSEYCGSNYSDISYVFIKVN